MIFKIKQVKFVPQASKASKQAIPRESAAVSTHSKHPNSKCIFTIELLPSLTAGSQR